jgi:hypothetical protein
MERKHRLRLAPALVASLFLLHGFAVFVAADSASCRQASEIVADIERQYQIARPDHTSILERLATARDLCPSLGVAWKYSYCSAKALGQDAKARTYADRAVFNGVQDLTCGASPAAEHPAARLGPVRDKHALIVGIGRFRDPQIPALKYTAKDARDVHDFLVDPRHGRFPPENVSLLVDDMATRENILIELQKLFVRAAEDDLVLIYVSSHGSPQQGELGLQGVGYIVTYDTRNSDRYLDAIEFQDFAEKVSLVKARRKVTFLDTCYSGQALRPGAKTLAIQPFGVTASTAQLFLSGEGTYVITSSSGSQQSWESDSLENSYFTHFLLGALRQDGEPPTLKAVFAELVDKVTAAVARDKRARQEPQIYSVGGQGDLRIGVQPTATTFSATARVGEGGGL